MKVVNLHMNSQEINPIMRGILLCGVVLFQLFAAQIDAQRSTSPWRTLNGHAPLVIARGGFSGMYPDSSLAAYDLATQKSLAGVVQWCDVQLTQDEVGICFPDLNLANASSISERYPNGSNIYKVDGVPTQAWFTIDFSLRDLTNVSLTKGIKSRSPIFDENGYKILTIQDVSKEIKKSEGLWLNVQHDTFYAENNMNMSRFLLSVSKTVNINFISSPEVNFFEKIAGYFGRNGPIFVFRFLGKEDIEPTTKQTYASILSNLTFVKTFASGILVPKSYILPVNDNQYLLPHTSLVQDAHKAGLQVYVSGFANDAILPYNYSYDPVSEYLSFVDNVDFSVDGVLSDFPITASASIDCLSHISRNDTKQVDFLVISNDGASGDYPGCTDLAYKKAIEDGADVIDCSVQMSSDGIPFCLRSIDLKASTTVTQTPFRNRTTSVPEIQLSDGIFTFNLTWPEIRNLTPAIFSPFAEKYPLLRNPIESNSGKLILLSEFLNLAKNSITLSGVLISVENAAYLREKLGLDVIKLVLDTLTDTGYNNGTTKTKVFLLSTDSSVLEEFKKRSKYETIYKIDKIIGDILGSAVEDIKKFANAVVIKRSSVFLSNADDFLTGKTNIVQKLQKHKLAVYVEVFRNEVVSLAFDFFTDATVQINTYIFGVGINGTITDFPLTAARYKRNRCLGFKESPPYMSVIQPGKILSTVNPKVLPPAEPPNVAFTDDDVTEPPLPPVKAETQTSTFGTPSTNAQAPSGQTRLALSLLLYVFCLSSVFLINR